MTEFLFHTAFALSFLAIGRWSIIRGTRYRLGNKILGDLAEVLKRRDLVGDGMIITNTRGWRAFGYDWKISITQE
jgi:hypothetical protein